MKLLGAKEFLKSVKPGTLFVEFWMDNEQECFEIINDFENGINILDKYYGEFLIYGDNAISLTFLKCDIGEEVIIDNTPYDCCFCYDHNIIGDASPTTTLNLIFENEKERPKQIRVGDTGKDFNCEDEYINKEDIKKIIKWFLKDYSPFDNEKFGWALKEIKTNEFYKNNYIINYKRTIKKDT